MRIFLLSLLGLIMAFQIRATPIKSTSQTEVSSNTITLEDIRDLKNKDLRKKLGRRLSLKESIAFSILRGKLKRIEKKKRAASEGVTVADISAISSGIGLLGFILAVALSPTSGALTIIGFFGSLIGLILGAIGKSEFKEGNPKKLRLAKFGFISGLIVVSLYVIFMAIALVAFANLFK